MVEHGVHTQLVVRVTVVQVVTPMEALVSPVISVLEMVGAEEMEIQGLAVQAECLLAVAVAEVEMVVPQGLAVQVVKAK